MNLATHGSHEIHRLKMNWTDDPRIWCLQLLVVALWSSLKSDCFLRFLLFPFYIFFGIKKKIGKLESFRRGRHAGVRSIDAGHTQIGSAHHSQIRFLIPFSHAPAIPFHPHNCLSHQLPFDPLNLTIARHIKSMRWLSTRLHLIFFRSQNLLWKISKYEWSSHPYAPLMPKVCF